MYSVAISIFAVVKSYSFIQGGAKGSLEKFEGYQSILHMRGYLYDTGMTFILERVSSNGSA